MILQASQRSGAKQLSDHLMRSDDNEHVEIHEVRGFVANDLHGALREAYATSQGTKCKQFMFSLSLNPPANENVPVEVFEDAIERAETKLGLDGQPRVVVFHEKEGRRHAHCVWSRIDTDEMKAVPLPHFKLKLRDLSKELYLEQRWEMPRGFIDSQARDPANFTLADWQQSKRTGLDPREVKSTFQECWAASSSKEAFAGLLQERGYYLARGDRRGYVALDYRGEVYAVAKYAGVATSQVREKLGDPAALPSVSETKALIASRMNEAVNGYIEEAKSAFGREAATLSAQKAALVESHREERKRLDAIQEARWTEETNARAARLPRGMRSLWSRITGAYGRRQRLNEAETYAAYRRDQVQRQEMIERQLEERRALQREIDAARRTHARDLSQLHRDVSFYVGFSAPGSVRAPERRRGQDRDFGPQL